MKAIKIQGGTRLNGTIRVNGAKNAVLPVIAATLLASGKSTITNVPNLNDVHTMGNVLRCLGCAVEFIGDKITVDATQLKTHVAPYALVRKMRASILIMGPLLARLGRGRIALPGGCAIGTRPIDLHLKGFSALGTEITIGHGFVEGIVQRKGLVGKKIYLDYPSVGATENIMMIACMAKGVTQIENAAKEPEIVDLATMLNSMGAHISGAGTDCIRIIGVERLHPAQHAVIPDRIEAGTYMSAAVMTGGDLILNNVVTDHIRPIIAKLSETGAEIEVSGDNIRVRGPELMRPVDVKTLPYPGFPTDMQAQMMALLTGAQGTSVISETVFENRFMHVDELLRMGANIRIDGRTAIIKGVHRLDGAQVMATDLRAGAALILAGLVAHGETNVTGVHHIERGYADIVEKLNSVGARMEEVQLD